MALQICDLVVPHQVVIGDIIVTGSPLVREASPNIEPLETIPLCKIFNNQTPV